MPAGGRLRIGKGPAVPYSLLKPHGVAGGPAPWLEADSGSRRALRGYLRVFGGAEEGAGVMTSACCLRARVSAIATGAG